jgi:Rrf2 family protein
MKLSTKCRYGLRAMIELARNYSAGPVNRKSISSAQHITKAYLENILTALREKKLVLTTRGAGGGFVLQRPPARITVLDIVNALEGSLAPVDCLDNPAVCEKSEWCPARQVWKKLYDAQVKTLSGISLQDIIEAPSPAGDVNYMI